MNLVLFLLHFNSVIRVNASLPFETNLLLRPLKQNQSFWDVTNNPYNVGIHTNVGKEYVAISFDEKVTAKEALRRLSGFQDYTTIAHYIENEDPSTNICNDCLVMFRGCMSVTVDSLKNMEDMQRSAKQGVPLRANMAVEFLVESDLESDEVIHAPKKLMLRDDDPSSVYEFTMARVLNVPPLATKIAFELQFAFFRHAHLAFHSLEILLITSTPILPQNISPKRIPFDAMLNPDVSAASCETGSSPGTRVTPVSLSKEHTIESVRFSQNTNDVLVVAPLVPYNPDNPIHSVAFGGTFHFSDVATLIHLHLSSAHFSIAVALKNYSLIRKDHLKLLSYLHVLPKVYNTAFDISLQVRLKTYTDPDTLNSIKSFVSDPFMTVTYKQVQRTNNAQVTDNTAYMSCINQNDNPSILGNISEANCNTNNNGSPTAHVSKDNDKFDKTVIAGKRTRANTGAIISTVVVFMILLLLLIGVYLCRRRRRQYAQCRRPGARTSQSINELVIELDTHEEAG